MIRDDLRLDPPVHIPYGVEVFDKLSISPFEFFLAGSRYMGCAKPDSDWDFITQDSPYVRQALERMGFKPLFEKYPLEEWSNTAEVMQYEEGSLKVQVQLQRSIHIQRAVRDIIKQHMLVEHIKMGREMRTILWDGLYHYLRMRAG